jgi:chemotaxis response regulator CheB
VAHTYGWLRYGWRPQPRFWRRRIPRRTLYFWMALRPDPCPTTAETGHTARNALTAQDHVTKTQKQPTKTPASPAKGRPRVGARSSGATSRLQFPVVGIGASAGGLEACTALLKALPVNPGMAFVLVQHLDPHHESILHKLLSRTTEMPVIQVEDGMALERDHVYVIPPNKDIAVRERTLRLLSRRRTAGRHLPINRFLVSLAEDQKSAAIGVILSGTASDGTVGSQAIKSEGGVAFAQDPKSAGYPGMPESAILARCVDFVLPPEEIARELVRLEHLPNAQRTAAVLEAEPPFVARPIFRRSSTFCGQPRGSISAFTKRERSSVVLRAE